MTQRSEATYAMHGGDGATRPHGFWPTLVADMAPQDWLTLAYFGGLVVSIAFGIGPGILHSLLFAGELIVAFLFGMALTRGGIIPRGTFLHGLVYRLAAFIPTFVSYFELRTILPACTRRAVDSTLYAIDIKVFGVEPALAWDRFVSPHTVEWFSFFYFGYFFLLALHILPFLFAARDMAMLARFAAATLLVFFVGHTLYVLVPGFGPYRALADQFHHPLHGGVFWPMVRATVEDAGAQKDIFPSIHTAIPVTFTALAFRYRKRFRPYAFSWPIVGFCASQIIIATMFLRWHYLIDIVAGLALAAFAVFAAERMVRWDELRRERLGLPYAWPPLWGCRRPR